MKSFDLLNAPLEGINLIEASAGTGKTYNIEGLFIRLLLEQQLQVDQILVLTFTNAATEELKDRIRHKLVTAKAAFAGEKIDDPLIVALANKYPDATAAGLRLHESLIDFDKAAIYTIHGFCQRVLHENAFETRNLFDTELIASQTQFIREVVNDFWRKSFYQSSLEFISFAVKRIKGPDYFYQLLGRLKTPDVTIVPDFTEPTLDTLPNYRASLNAVKVAWPGSREAVIQALASPSLNAKIYGSFNPAKNQPKLTGREVRLNLLFEGMDDLVNPASIGFPLFKNFENLTTGKIVKSTKKKHTPPEHDFFDLCQDLFNLEAQLIVEFERYLIFLKGRLFEYAAVELQKKKKKQNVQYFDDLLTTLKNALQSKSGTALAEAINRKYQAALVDEFQDTDNTQYQILSRLFSHDASLLFLIGDPKQAIYSFRGADIFSYMSAADRAGAKFTLTENWRSGPGLITAVNTIFGHSKAPFVFEEIPFKASRPGLQPAKRDAAPAAPLTLWYLEAKRFGSGDKLINKSQAVQLIANAVSAEINRLVSDSSPVVPGDIAVLVRTNDQAQLIKNMLDRRFVPAILYSTGNIFDAREAYEVQIILSGIADPTNVARVKAALATDIMGLLAEDLIIDDADSHRWDRRLVRFSEYNQTWQRFGFIRMFRLLLVEEQVRQRILSLPGGERRLTNIMHLAEILHRRSMDKNQGMTDLIKWLIEQRDPRTPRLEENQLRLESDEKAVQIVTIHKSKGLEYPIVFCPFGWEKSLIRNEEFTFHDIDDKRQLTLDLGSTVDRHIALAQNEILSENLRLLYVALTRARDRCYLAWGRIRTAETSALAYLLHCRLERPAATRVEDFTQLAKEQFMAKTESEFVEDLKLIADQSQKTIRIEPLPIESDRTAEFRPPKDNEDAVFARHFGAKINRAWKISSYSSLISAGQSDIDRPDRDLLRSSIMPPSADLTKTAAAETVRDDLSIFAFPKGTRAGTFFHDIFEHHEFSKADPKDLKQLVTEKIAQHGFDQKWRDTVCHAINDVLSINLPPDGNIKLSSIRMGERINEMEFYFPMKRLAPRKLAGVFNLHPQAEDLREFLRNLAKLDFRSFGGFMKGYIDMVFQHKGRFYLVDWKSNFLGADPKNYSQPALHQTMQTDLYILQYYIYTLALHQYLRNRITDYCYHKHFGGVYYIFIRGAHPSHGAETGIFFDLPEPEIVHQLGGMLIPGYQKD